VHGADVGKPWKCIDLKRGRSFEFGRATPNASDYVSWRPDESAVACVRFDPPDKYHAVVLNSSTGETVDFSEQFSKLFSGRPLWNDHTYSDPPAVERLWSADGQYLILANMGCLIRPSPWECIDVRNRIPKLLPHARIAQWVRRLAVRGWLMVRTEDGHLYAVDYGFSKIQPIDDLTFRGEAEVAPNGRYAFVGEDDSNFRVRKLENPLVPIHATPNGSPQSPCSHSPVSHSPPPATNPPLS